MIINQLEIRVLESQGKVLTAATVTAVPEAIGTSPTAQFDSARQLYFFEGLRPGFFAVTVEHAEYESQTRRIQVHPKPTRTTFLLGRPGHTYTFQGSARVPYTSQPELIGIIPALAGGGEADEVQSLVQLFETLRLTPEPAAVTGRGAEEAAAVAPSIRGGLVLRRIRGPLDDVGNDDLRTLRESPLVAAAGPLLQHSEAAFTIFTNQLFVRFRPEVTRTEAERLVASEDLTIVRPMVFAPNLFLVEADASIGEGINQVAERLLATGRVEYAEPHLAEVPELDTVVPTDYLWPGIWDRQLVEVEDAWQRLCDFYEESEQLGEAFQFGRPDIIIAVVDSGIKSVDGIPENPDFQGTVSDGSSKVYQLFDFQSLVANNDNPRSPHGVACAGVASGIANNPSSDPTVGIGVVGAAPNTRLIGLIYPFRTEELLDMFLWAAGLNPQSNLAGFPASIDPGADIITASVGFGRGVERDSSVEGMFDYLTRRGRNGKGVLAFFSSGNDDADIHNFRPYGGYERSFSCAATTLDNMGNEIRAPYSGWGLVEWCAPSHDRYNSPTDDGIVHDPPNRYATWTAHFRHQGNMPSVPAVRSNLAANVRAGDTSIPLTSVTGLTEKMYLLIEPPAAPGSEPVQITGVPDPITLNVPVTSDPEDPSRGLRNDHSRGDVVIGGSRLVSTLTRGAPPGTSRIFVGDVFGLGPGMQILLGETGTPLSDREELTITGYPDVTTGRVPVSSLTMAHDAGSEVVIGNNHHRNDHGGTSSATPLCAGIAALVLSAQPDLTWVEAREILRDTADRFDTTNTDPIGQWLDANGNPSTQTGLDPVFSQWYGYGRLNANKAVAEALDYGFTRDLMIRNTLSDDGENPTATYSDSPDIWVRNADPANDPGALPASYDVAGPHQKPRRDHPRWIYARIRNRGTEASLDAWVRFYVASSYGGPFEYPQDWEPRNGLDNQAPDSWEPGTYFIDRVALPSIAAGAHIVVNIPWPEELMPPPLTPVGHRWKPNLLVEVTPQDGPLTGARIRENNNLAQKAILKRPVLSITPRDELDFGDVPVGTPSRRELRVYNAGRAALEVIPVELTGEDFYVRLLGQTVTVLPKRRKFIDVEFAPPEVCERTGELSFKSNDADKSLVKIRLHGRGVPWVSANPPWLHCGRIGLDEWGEAKTEFTNVAPFAFSIAEVSVDLQDAQAEFKATTEPHEPPFRLRPGESFVIYVSARPTAKGEQNASLEILCVYKSVGPDWEPERTMSFSIPLTVIGV